MRVKLRRAPNSLARIIDDEIQAWMGLQQMAAEAFHAGRMPQVKPKDFETMPPLFEIRFLCIAPRRITGEAGSDDQSRSRSQQFKARLITDLHASAGQQRHTATQVREFGTLLEIELRARRTHLVVKMVNGRELLLADVAMVRIDLPDVLRFV